MNYSEAVALALEGKEQGFQFLYEESSKSKYYLALQYSYFPGFHVQDQQQYI